MITGSIGIDRLVINMSEPGSFNLASLFFNWNFDINSFTVNGSSGDDQITFDNVPGSNPGGGGR